MEKVDKMTESTPDVTLAFQVKAYDIDLGGVVHNSVYLLWLEDVRTAFLEKVQSIEELIKLGTIPVISKTEISYKRAIKFGDRPVAHMHLTLVTRLRWKISCDFVVNGNITTQAVQEGCLVDLNTGRPVPVPESFIRYWDAKNSSSAGDSKKQFEAIDSFGSVACPV